MADFDIAISVNAGNGVGKSLHGSIQARQFTDFFARSIPPCESDADVLKAEIAAHSKVSLTHVRHKIFQGSKLMSSIASYPVFRYWEGWARKIPVDSMGGCKRSVLHRDRGF